MRRKQISQFIDQDWLPAILKQNIKEFLSWFVLQVNATKPFIPVIQKGLSHSGGQRIINLEFNRGAGIESVEPFLDEQLEVHSNPIADFNTSKNGLYLFVNCFHQLAPEKAKKLLKDITASKNPVVIVEGNNDSLWQIVGMTFFVPLTVLLTSCFVKPFRWSRLLFTYLIPILPLIIVIDGCIALLKLYNPADLTLLTRSIQAEDYVWEIGKDDNNRGGKIIYLIGHQNAEVT